MRWSEAISGMALLVALAGFLMAYFRPKASVEMEERLAEKFAGSFQELQDCINDDSRKIVALETKMDLFWRIVEQNMASILHRPTHKEMDELLEKRERGEPLQPDESVKLERMLVDLINDRNEPRDLRSAAAHMLAARIARKTQTNA